MKLRIGFIGIGAMGLSHVKAMHLDNGRLCEAVAICGTNPEHIKRALEIAPKALAFQKPKDLIESDLDAVFVSTPNFTHAALALDILRAGKHLFLEKPIGINRTEAEKLSRASEKSDRVVMVGHELRYSPYFQKIHDLVQAGEIGRPRMVWCKEFRGPFQKKSQDWIQDATRSGGTLVDKNCHHFDLMNWWVGSRPKRVCAFGSNAVNRVIEGENQVLDHATLSFEYENGVLGSHQLCMFALDFPKEDLEMGIVGERGMLVTRISQIQILQWKRGANQHDPIVHVVQARHGEGWGSHLGFAEIHEEFVRCIRENRKPLTSIKNCIDGTLLAIAAEEAVRRREIVEIK
jgi:myo-inositol 2-dehydrogenase / D-chiro-inositol 1-dehydrogenase